MSQQASTKIKCADCGKTDIIPFKPTAGKPVYYRECLAKHRTEWTDIGSQMEQEIKNQTMKSNFGLDEEKNEKIKS